MDPDWNPRPLDLLLGYKPGMTLPSVRKRTDKQWHPEDAFRLRPTEEHHWFWVKRNVTQTRWRVLSERISKMMLSRAALEHGRRLARKLIERGIADMSDVNDADKAHAEEAMAFAAAVVRGAVNRDGVQLYLVKERLAAAKILLDFCRAKPAQKSDVTIHRAEDFLDAIED